MDFRHLSRRASSIQVVPRTTTTSLLSCLLKSTSGSRAKQGRDDICLVSEIQGKKYQSNIVNNGRQETLVVSSQSKLHHLHIPVRYTRNN